MKISTVMAWELVMTNAENTIFYLDRNHTLVRYDYSTPIRNTYGIIRRFNITPGTSNITIFTNPCPSNV
ncbi:hypothetical protein I4U23_020212 [Adineta vaga]|nr:hypothetical protein I4U23_020212 [Adineta vaga]